VGLRYPCGRRGGDVRATAPVVRALIADAFISLRVRRCLARSWWKCASA